MRHENASLGRRTCLKWYLGEDLAWMQEFVVRRVSWLQMPGHPCLETTLSLLSKSDVLKIMRGFQPQGSVKPPSTSVLFHVGAC